MATQHGLECVVVGRLIACCCFWWREQAYTKTAIHLHLQRFVIRLADNKASQNSNVMLELKLDNLDANISMIVPETCVHVVAELPSLVAIDSHVGRDRLRAEVSVGGIVFRDLNAPHNATPLLNSRLKPVLQFHPSPLKLPRAVHRSEEDESGEAMEGDSERMLSGKPAFAQLLRNHEHFNILSSFVCGFGGEPCVTVCACVWVGSPYLTVASACRWSKRGTHGLMKTCTSTCCSCGAASSCTGASGALVPAALVWVPC